MSDWETAIEQPVPSPPPASEECHTLEESIAFAPRRRPWYPHLIILDDHSSDSGEVVRFRKDAFTLGRVDCDLSFPAEALMSGTHAKVSLQEISPKHWDWVLEDLSSRNGVFVRQTEFPLRPGNEFLIGGTKVIVHGDSQLARNAVEPIPSYSAYEAEAGQIRNRSELEICPYLFSQEATIVPLRAKRIQLGRNGEGAISLAVDPFVEPLHALIQKTDSHSWKIVDQKSLNGIWVRVRRAVLSQTTSFILGEQRFRFTLFDRN
jgi:pSer/pThr/pTyr-binding forkhead associated (FHA) protein